ncbi:MAG: DUF2786 domain-containing protein [Victivallaceae bacterium]|nr:DUF2786 domain-containing protein [Victivallaceae bacterium]
MKVIDRIKKLLALSNSPNENEAASALAKAMDLCSEHNLSLESVKAIPDGEAITHRDISGARTKTPKWEKLLAASLAKMFNCVCLNSRGIYKERLQVVGYSSDSEICAYVYDFLHNQIPKITREHMKTKHFRKSYRRDAYRKDFMRGVVLSVLAKARKTFNKTHQGESTGLIVRRLHLVNEYLKEFGAEDYELNFKDRRKDALYAGYSAGDKVDIRRGVYKSDRNPIFLNT